MSNDYQNQMGGITLAADKAGNDAAMADLGATKELAGSGHDLSKWGALPAISVPMDYAMERQQFFRGELERTLKDGPSEPFQSKATIQSSGALKTQKEMLDNYTADINDMPGAEQQYNMFAPLATQAAMATVKVDSVGRSLGVGTNTNTSSLLDKKHLDAMKKAVVAEKMQEGDSIKGKGDLVLAARNKMVAASLQMKNVLTKQVMKKLGEEVAENETKKKEINEKIEKVEQWAGYAEKGVGLIAGGAGALAGAGEAAAAEGAAESVADTTMTKVKEGAEKTEKGIGIVGKVAGGIAQLYYQKQLDALDARIGAAQGEIASWGHTVEANELAQAQAAFDGATGEYKAAVQAYDAAIQDRRMHMASAGAVADKNAGGKDQLDSQAMLWIESAMEAKANIAVAKDAGNAAKVKLEQTAKALVAHRTHQWSNIEDIWGKGSGSDREDGTDHPDVHAVAQMSRLTNSWLAGATLAQTYLDKSLGDGKSAGEKKNLADAGYSGEF